MKKIAFILSSIGFISCSTDDKQIENITSNKYEVQIVNGVETNNKRETTKECGTITETGTEQLPGVDLDYYWVVVCRPKM